MKMIKNLLVTVLCVSVMASSLPAFAAGAAPDTATMIAATTTTATAGRTESQMCQSLGLVKGKGDGVTDSYLASNPNRLQAAIAFLRLKGLEEVASSFNRPDNFADVNAVGYPAGVSILAYLVAHPSLGFQGYGNNFKPNDTLTAKQYYKVLLEALGYKQGQDFEWKDTLTFAADKGLSKVASVNDFTMNDLCTATVEALSAKVKGSNETLVAQLVDRGGIKKESAQAVGLIPQEVVKAERDHERVIDLGDTAAPMPLIVFVSYSNVNNSKKVTVSISCVDPTAGFHYTYSVGGAENTPNADSPYLSSAGTIEIPLDGAPNQDTRITVRAYSSVPGKADSPIYTLGIMGNQLLQG